MKSLVCSISNADTKEFGALLLFPSEKVAEAQFKTWCDKQEEDNKYFDRTDYSLHIIATFDSESGSIKLLSKIAIVDSVDKE